MKAKFTSPVKLVIFLTFIGVVSLSGTAAAQTGCDCPPTYTCACGTEDCYYYDSDCSCDVYYDCHNCECPATQNCTCCDGVVSEECAHGCLTLPTASIVADGSTSLCSGGSVTLHSSDDEASYLWSNGETTSAITVTAADDYTLTVTNSDGCSATSSTITVTAGTVPAATIGADGSTTICSGSSVTLHSGDDETDYLWSNGETTSAITVTEAGEYTLKVTNSDGCTATSTAIDVTVNASPTATIDADGNTTFCSGSSVTLHSGDDETDYLWSNGETTSAITVTEAGEYTLKVTNSDGCTATSGATTVTVSALPTASIDADGNTTFCSDDFVILSSSDDEASYLWSDGETTSSIIVTSTGNYTLTVTNSAGCSATSQPAVNVTVQSAPAIPTITSPTTICPGTNISSISFSGGNDNTTTEVDLWVGNNDLTSATITGGSTSWSISPTNSQTLNENDNITVTATNAAGCTSTSLPLRVTDNTPPTVICNSTTPVLNIGSDGLTTTLLATDVDGGSTDLCLMTLKYAISPAQFSCSDVGLASTTLTVTNISGLSSSKSCPVQVNSPPFTITSCPSNMTRAVDPGLNTYSPSGEEFDPTITSVCPTISNYTLTGATDSHGAQTATSLDGVPFNSGIVPNNVTTVLWTVTDGQGNNPATCTFTVTVTPSDQSLITSGSTQLEPHITIDPTNPSNITVTGETYIPSTVIHSQGVYTSNDGGSTFPSNFYSTFGNDYFPSAAACPTPPCLETSYFITGNSAYSGPQAKNISNNSPPWGITYTGVYATGEPAGTPHLFLIVYNASEVNYDFIDLSNSGNDATMIFNPVQSGSTYYNAYTGLTFTLTINAGTTYDMDTWYLPVNYVGACGDPSITCDPYGTCYVSDFNYAGYGNSDYITISSTTGTSWTAPVNGNAGATPGYFDREMIAGDETDVYCGWIDAGFGMLKFNSANYPTPIILQNAAGYGSNVQTGPYNSGIVYECWTNVGINGGAFNSDAVQFAVINGYDGTLGSVTVTPNIITFNGIEASSNFAGPNINVCNVRTPPIPSMAIDKSCLHNGRVYITFSAIDNASSKKQIELYYNDPPFTNAWTHYNTAKINASADANWLPYVCVDDMTGTVSIVYYSETSCLASAYIAYCTDVDNVNTPFNFSSVSNSSWNLNNTTLPPPGFGAGSTGDYIGITSYNGTAYPAWTEPDFPSGSLQWRIHVAAVTVDPQLFQPISVTITPADNNGSCTLTATASGGNPCGYTYSWSDGETISSITVTCNSTTTYSVTATDHAGHSSHASYDMSLILSGELWMMDNPAGYTPVSGRDVGVEPDDIYNNSSQGVMWVSGDINVQPDPIITTDEFFTTVSNQSLSYTNSTTPNYIFVNVRNMGNGPSKGTEILNVHWTKGTLSNGFTWPSCWNGSVTVAGDVNCMAPAPPTGDLIIPYGTDNFNYQIINGTSLNIVTATTPASINSGISDGDIIIPVLQPGDIVTFQIPWIPQDPANYLCLYPDDNNNNGPHPDLDHFCLLARVEINQTSDYGMTYPEGPDVWTNTYQNNKIVWKNIAIVNKSGVGPEMPVIITGNNEADAKWYDILYRVPAEELANAISDKAKISIDLGQQLYQKWAAGGYYGYGFEYTTDNGNRIITHLNNTLPYSIIVDATIVAIDSLLFQPHETDAFGFQVNYTALNNSNANHVYNIDAIQVDGEDNSISGGERYQMTQPLCPTPHAGNDVIINPGASTVLTALPVESNAVFNWYNTASGALLGSGQTFQVSPGATTTYKLEMVSPNGCLDYSQVTVVIGNLSPVVIITGVNTLCASSTLLSAETSTAGNGGTITSYQWQLNGVPIVGATGVNYFATASGVYSVAATNNSGYSATSAATTVSLNTMPIAPAINGAPAFCTGSATVLGTTLSYTGYQWSTGELSSSINVGTVGNYSVTVTDINGCTGTAVAIISQDNAAILITVGTSSSAGATVLDAGQGYSNYLWSTGETTQMINFNASTYTLADELNVAIAGAPKPADWLNLSVQGLPKPSDWLTIAINGSGYFELLNGDEIVYSKSGVFSTNSEGQIIDVQSGFLLYPTISIPFEMNSIQITQGGVVQIGTWPNGANTTVGQIYLATFIAPTGLDTLGNGVYLANVNSGEAISDVPGGSNGSGLLAYRYPQGLSYTGDAFFQLHASDGTIVYTQNGRFSINSSGEIIDTATGYMLEPQITLPANANSIQISPDGTVKTGQWPDGTNTTIGQIQLARFPNSLGLTPLGNGIFAASDIDLSGSPIVGNPGYSGLGPLAYKYPEGLSFPGDAYFQLKASDGTFAYTRNGAFTLDSSYNIISKLTGYPVEPPITIPSNADSIIVGANGVVQCRIPGQTGYSQVGQLQLSTFINSLGLTPIGNNLYTESGPSGTPDVESASPPRSAIHINNYNIVSVSVTDNYGCIRSGSANVQALTNVAIATQDTSVCQGSSVTLDAGSGYSSYLWSTGETTESINFSTGANTILNQLNLGIQGAGKPSDWLTIAVNGSGYFALTASDGSTVYTRNGAFSTNAFGQIIYTPNGYILEPQITIPVNANFIIITPDGVVQCGISGQTGYTQLGQLQLTTFNDPTQLTPMGNDLFAADAILSGSPVVSNPGTGAAGLIIYNYPQGLSYSGDWYFILQASDGTNVYTRNGSFALDNSGNVIYSSTSNGVYYLQYVPYGQSGLQNFTVASNTDSLIIEQDGTVKSLLNGQTNYTIVGQLELANFENSLGLNYIGNNLYVESYSSSGPATFAPPCGSVAPAINHVFDVSVSVTNDNGWIKQGSRRVTILPVPAPPVITANGSTVLCVGSSVTLDNGASGYCPAILHSLWNTVDSSEMITVSTAGNYYSTITNIAGCSAASLDTVKVTVSTASAGAGKAVCRGDSATIGGSPTASGGTAPYIYTWNPSIGLSDNATANPKASPDSTVSYIVTVTDSIGCVSSDSVLVTIHISPSAVISSSTNITTCYGDSIGSATVSVSSGTYPYNYIWSPFGGTDSIATGLIAGGYTMTVTDSNGCIAIAIDTITQPTALIDTITGLINSSCYGDSIGSATVSVNGGTTPYTYIWSPGSAMDSTVTGLTAGSYTVAVTDANGCAATFLATIAEPAAPGAYSNSPVSVGDTLQLSADTIPNATYIWTGPNGFTSTAQNPMVSSSATWAMAGTYSLSTTVNGCMSSPSTVPVTITGGLTLIMDTVSGGLNSLVTISVKADGFTNLIGAQGTIKFDQTVVSFVETGSYALPGMGSGNFGTSQVSNGKLMFEWYQQTLSGVTLPSDSTIFTIQFRIIGAAGQYSALNFVNTPTPIQFVDASFNTITANLISGRVNVSSTVSISGAVVSVSGDTIPIVTLNVTGSDSQTQTTGVNGLYSFYLTPGANDTISASKNNDSDVTNGVTVYDILLIIQYIEGNQTFNPYQLIAADVDLSGMVSMLDVDYIQAFILGNINTFNGRLWNFVPSNFVFPNDTIPFSHDSFQYYSSVDSPLTNQNFIGMQLGNINNDFNSVRMSAASRQMFLDMPSENVLPGENITIPLSVKQFKSMSGYQFTVNWNPAVLSFEGVQNAAIHGFYGLKKQSEGAVTAIWTADNAGSLTLPDETLLFDLTFKAIGTVGTSSPINITSSITPMEAVDSSLEPVDLASTPGFVNIVQVISDISEDVKLYPNPTNGKVTVIYHLNSSSGILQLYNVIGELVGSFKLDGNNNAFEFDASYLCCGVFEYKVMSNESLKGQGKLVILK